MGRKTKGEAHHSFSSLFHVTKLNVLKIPLKGLLGGFHIELSDLVHASNIPGVQIVENDIIFDTQKLLPPPHIHGALTSVRVRPPDIEVVYGDAGDDEARLAQWHNFLRLSGGTLDFGKLTMHHVDLTMIDASQDPWFDLDLVNYQAQLVNGYTRMTPQAGPEIFMPHLDEETPKRPARASLSNGSKTATAHYRSTFQSSSARFANRLSWVLISTLGTIQAIVGAWPGTSLRLIGTISSCQAKSARVEVWAFFLMPNHVHPILNPQQAEVLGELALRDEPWRFPKVAAPSFHKTYKT